MKKKRETVEKFYSMKCVGMLLLASDGRKDGSRCTKGITYSERIT